jgi:hypothetical protein
MGFGMDQASVRRTLRSDALPTRANKRQSAVKGMK